MDPASLVVDILLVDYSMYRLQRTHRNAKNGLPSDMIGSLTTDLETHPSISITFEGRQPDLLFVLGVCYGIMKQEKISGVLAPNSFACALVLNIVQETLPLKDRPQESFASSIEPLWNDAFEAMADHGYTFWADTAAERVKIIMHELISKVARKSISSNLSSSPHISTPDPSSVMAAALVMARTEAVLEIGELSQLRTWDMAWDNAWRQRQDQPSSRRSFIWKLKNKSSSIESSPAHPSVLTTGQRAGRLPREVQLSFLSLSEPSLALVRAGLIGAHWSKESPAFRDLDLKGATTHLNNVHTLNIQNQSSAADLNNQVIWVSAIESAVENAWDTVWLVAMETGENFAESRDLPPASSTARQITRPGFHNSRSSTTRTAVKHPAIGGMETCGRIIVERSTQTSRWMKNFFSRKPSQQSPQNDLELTPVQPTEATTTLQRAAIEQQPKPELAVFYKRLQETLVIRPSQSSSPRNMNHKYDWVDIIREYRNAYQNKKESAREQSKRSMASKRSARAGQFSKSELIKHAEKAWEFTQWVETNRAGNEENLALPILKECWMEAWQAVWDQVWDIAVTKGVDFGVAKALGNNSTFKRSVYIYGKLSYTNSYKKLEEYFNSQESALSSLRLFYSMIRELQHLFESHQRTIHRLHNEVKITVYPDAQPLLSKLAESGAQEPGVPYAISYSQLQNLLIAKCITENNRGESHNLRNNISKVWHFAKSAYRTSHKDRGDRA